MRRLIHREIIETKNKLLELSSRKVYKTFYGGYFSKGLLVEDLITYLKLLYILSFQMQYVKPCITIDEFRKIIEKFNNFYCKTSLTDFKTINKEQEWAKLFPLCRTYEQWEKWSKLVCQKLELEIVVEDLKCDLTFDLITENITCDLIVDLKTTDLDCDLTFDIEALDQECELSFNLFVEEFPTTTLTVTDFATIIPVVEMTTLQNIYRNNLEVEIKNNTVYLKTDLNSYPISDFKNIPIDTLKTIIQDNQQ